MKYIKLFENNNEPQLGDYVICSVEENVFNQNLVNFLSQNVGQYIDININKNWYKIQYKNISFQISVQILYRKNYIWVQKNNVIYFSSNFEDCEIYLNTNKYNL